MSCATSFFSFHDSLPDMVHAQSAGFTQCGCHIALSMQSPQHTVECADDGFVLKEKVCPTIIPGRGTDYGAGQCAPLYRCSYSVDNRRVSSIFFFIVFYSSLLMFSTQPSMRLSMASSSSELSMAKPTNLPSTTDSESS